MECVIRPYRMRDLAVVSEIYRIARPFEFAGEAGVNPLRFRALTQEEEILQMFMQSQVFVLEEDGVIKGFSGYVHDYIAWLYVHPDFHRQRVGHRLLVHILGLIGNKPARISSVASNRAARACYESFGFQQVGVFEFELQEQRLQGVRMERPLPTAG